MARHEKPPTGSDDRRRPNVRVIGLGLCFSTLVTASAIFVDRPIALSVGGLPVWLLQAARWLSDAASPLFVLPMLAGVLIFELCGTGNRSSHRPSFGIVSLCGAITALLSSALIKNVIGRARPYASADLGTLHFKPFSFEDAFASMPSSQSAFATAILCLLASYFPNHRTLLLSMSVLVCASRVIVREHWLSDVIGGWTLGYLVALAMVQLFAAGGAVSSDAKD
jgi:membrane-associated phospholipid phosphatase